jgi:hypothetical protein
MADSAKLNLFSRLSLVTAFLVAFLSAISANYYKFEITEQARDAYYTANVKLADCLAVIPKIGQNSSKNIFSPLRTSFLQFFLGVGAITSSLFALRFTGKIPVFPINIKKSIILKLRI